MESTKSVKTDNIINLVTRIKQREQQIKEEVDKDAPFAESSAELIAEFLYFCRERGPTLNLFCDLLCEELKNGAEQPLLDMLDRIKKNVTLKARIRKRNNIKKFSLPSSSRRKRIRTKRAKRKQHK